MSITDRFSNISKTSIKSTPTSITSRFARVIESPQEQISYNNGGFFGGLGYAFEKIGLGFLSGIEGIWDFTAGGLADLFGADEWAEEQFANDWVNYNDANEWYNPDSTWKVVGDVGMGIGTSLPAIAAAAGSAAAIYFSGGSATGAVAGFWSKYGPALVSSTIAGLGAAGQSTKAAYEKTGELGIKEYGYGALSGVAEAGMEFVSAGIGTGTGRLVKGMTTKAAKKTAETVAKSAGKATSLAITTKAITKGLLKDFAGEAFEEGIQEFIDPMLQRWTQVDPDAENATAQQIAYAALVGGLAGVVMGGAGNITSSIVDSAYYHHKGSQFAKNPELTTSIINQARQTAEYETQHNTGEGVYKKSKDLVEKFDKLDNGTGTLTYGQKRLLGEMAATNSAYILSEPVKRSKQNIIDHAEEFVKAINERGVIDGTTGQPFNFKSADELIKNESLLTQFAVGDALGRLLMSKDSVYDLVMSNGRTDVLMQGDFRNFQKEASPQQKQAVNEFLGIDIDSTTFEDFKRKIETMPRQNMETQQTVMNIRKQSKTEIKKLVNTNADVQEITNRTVFAEGMSVFKTKKGEMFTITKQGNQYYLYADGNVTKPLTKTQLKEIIKQMIGAKKNTNANTGANTQTTTTATQVVNENQNTPRGGVVENSSTERQGKPATETTTESQDGGKPKKNTKKSTKGDVRYAASENAVPNGSNSQQLKPLEMKRAESYAQNNIPGYNNLTQAEKLEVEWTLASGWRVGKDTTEILNLAKLSTAIGAGIGFANLSTTTKDGKIISPDAVCYTRGGHLTIYLNPNGKRTVKSATMHELTHSLEGVDGYSELQSMAEKYYNEHPDEKKAIDDLYRKVYADEQVRYAEEILPAELTAHYVETMLDSRDMLAELTKSEPTFMEKCISKLKAIRDKFKKVKDSDTNEVDLLINKFNFVFNQYKNKSNQTVDATRYATKRGKDGFERDKYFDRQIDKWQELKDGSYIKVGNILENSAINKVGIPSGTLYFDVSKIKKSMTAHFDHLDSNIIKRVPELLADPIVITKYDNSTVNVFGEIFVNGSPLLVGVVATTDGSGKHTVNKIRTIHARRDVNTIINDNNVLYLNENKKRTQNWFQTLGKQVPLSGQSFGFINSIRNNSENVNTSQKKFALQQTDSENNTLSVEQQEYFKDSQVRDKNNNLLVVYHGSDSTITTFSKDKLVDKLGFFFSQESTNGFYGKERAYYLNIKKVATIKQGENWTTMLPKSLTTEQQVARLKKLGYDGIKLVYKKPKGGETIDWVAFESNQIKLITNNKPTKSSDVRYALPSTDSQGKTLSKEQQSFFKDTKVVDENGNLLEVYHRTFNDFTVFDKDKIGSATDYGMFGYGFYFSNDDFVNYGKYRLDVYLNITNPYVIKSSEEVRKFIQFERELVNKTNNENLTKKDSIALTEELKKQGYDGVIYYDKFGKNEFIAFESNQVKLTTNTKPTINEDIRYALSETVEEEVKKSYGTTYNWRETGYLLKDGTRLDLSGKKQGARGNSRTVDHRDIFDNYEIDGSDAMIEFMGRGNIRVSPEYPGINIQTEPTQEQYRLIQDFVERVGWKEEYFSIDFDDSNGDVIDTLSYEGKMSGRKVVEDIKYFFKEGKVPFKSDLSQFRYALNPEDVRGSNLVTTEMSDERITFKDVFTRKKKVSDFGKQIKNDSGEFTESFRIATTNAQAGIERVLKQTGSSNAEAITNYVRAGKNAGQSALTVGQFSLDGETYMGESWQKIWQPIYTMDKKHPGAYKMFQTYLLHYHNTDRYVVGKPVFGDSITDMDSWAEIKKIETSYPTFKKQAEKVWKFLDNNLQLALDSGLYSKEYVQELRETYPHYVPTLRVEHQIGISTIQGRGNIRVNPNKKKAVGSDTEILPIDNTVAEQTIQRYSSARINEMLHKIANGKPHEEFRIIGGESLSADIDTDTLVTTHQDKNTNQITFWQDGKSVTAEVSTNLYKGVEAFMPSNDNVFNNIIINGVAKINTVFKKLVTAWNPFFVFYKNPMRDMQTALMYSRYSWKTYGKNYARAVEEIRNGGRYWQEAQAAGILSASVYDYRKGLQYKNKGKWANIVGKLESMSNSIEMAPRMAEYISARESGLSVQEALLQAQDLTTNFGRSGTLTKKANATFMPFLNPAVQGFSKLARAYTGKDAAKSWLNLIIRSLILGIGLSALNDLLNEDDEDYQNLSDHIKNSNYVLAIGDGQFLKIPKGRENGFIGELYLRARRSASGETDAWDGTLNSFISNLTPTDNFTRHIFSPLVDLKTNSTWYGGTIESQKWDNTEPKNRYDESTSRISIWLGQIFNYSPIKIDYLFEQYGGIVADIALPATNLEAESGIITQNMLVNSTTNSRWSTQFYSQLEKYNYKKTEGDVYAKGVVKYLNGVNETISKLYKQKREVQSSQTVRNSEKLTQVKVIQATINALQKDSLTNAKILYEELKKYDLSTDEQFEQGYLDSISSVVSAEYALEKYNKKVYERATTLNKLGIDYETYYDYYFGLKEVTTNGSKKAIVMEYTLSQNIPLIKQIILIMSAGYTINDGDIKGVSKKYAQKLVAKHLSTLPITLKEKVELAEFCGLTVKNGRIIFK